MIASSDIYQSKLNCQEDFFVCNNNHEQRLENGFRHLNLFSTKLSDNKKENCYFDKHINSNQPELKRVKVNLDTNNITASNFCSKINSSSINIADLNTNSVKHLIYKKINEKTTEFNSKFENQLVLDNNKNINRTTSKCNSLNPCYLTQHDKYKVHQFDQPEKLVSNCKTNMNLHQLLNETSEQDMNSSSTNRVLAYENLTYLSSDEDDIDNLKLGRDTTQQITTVLGQDILKKTTIKSIKRKDKLKKNSNFEISSSNKSLAKSMPDLTVETIKPENKLPDNQNDFTISDNEYEKILRKQLRNTTITRSLRRAKCVYYKNIRSKSLEDLTCEERANYLVKAAANLEKLRYKALSKLSLNSCASTMSNAVSITSSNIRDLNDWSPDFSSDDSESSHDDFDDFDWEANLSLSQLDLNDSDSEDNSSSSSSSSSENEENYIVLNENKILNSNLKIRDELNEPNNINHKNKIEYIEKMMNEIMIKMVNVFHIDLNCIKNADSYDLIKNIKYTRIRNEDIEYHNNCSICSLEYELDDEVASIDCNHTFHKHCLNFWLAKVNSCPVCCCQRKSISHRETLL